MKYIVKIFLQLIVVAFIGCSSNKEKILEINGTVINTDTKSILLLKPAQDFRFDSLTEIPVKDGKFHYQARLEHPEAVNLMLGEAKENGGGRTMPLFLENEKIDLTIHSEQEFDKNSVQGGTLNKQYQIFKTQTDSLLKGRPFEEQLKWQEGYISKNPSLISYYLFLEHLVYFKEYIDVDLAKRNYKILYEAIPNHPYNDLAYHLISAIENIKIGKDYVDFSASDLSGNEVRLSDEINGKIALLDLWATWCGPCIAKSRTMLPVYNEYKNKGFTIVGVAGEFKNTDRLFKFLEKEKWPWLNLVELDRENAIWQKYGVDGGGGGLFLIDEKGKILAIDPTDEEVKKELKTRLSI
ncbi:AhpC/TSA family protein [Flavobacteriaceae bacterium XHP0103]|uniref:TlpA disulfide reductase family protein n=1 Tax=Marixanthotalea marina TaxID=2844359 RepID=UPI002989B939|nr:TlpA disulfide reductase family protein [Marixanthotalea marina]MBU3820751.1 AhpC/TSA family protein [Marixanthotalea marina]